MADVRAQAAPQIGGIGAATSLVDGLPGHGVSIDHVPVLEDAGLFNRRLITERQRTPPASATASPSAARSDDGHRHDGRARYPGVRGLQRWYSDRVGRDLGVHPG